MIEEDLAKLNTMNINELKKLFLRYFNAHPTLKTKEAYILKLSYRMQELEFGGLSSASRSFLSKISAKAPNVKKVAIAPIGTKIIKQYKGRDYVIRVLENGYELDGQRFKSLAVKHTVSGLLKLLYPEGDYTKDAVERCLIYALETRRRVKEQLKKIGGMEFYDVHFSYIDQETLEEKFVSVPEQGGGSLIPENELQPGVLYTATNGATNNHLGLYRIETQMTNGNGKLNISGMGSNTQPKEALKIAFDYFKANATRLMASVNPENHEYHIHVVEFHNTGVPLDLSLASFIALVSVITNKPVESQMVVLGSMTLGGNISPISNLAETLQVAFDAGAKKILIPMANVKDIPSVPGELFGKFQTSFYTDPIDAAFKALGML